MDDIKKAEFYKNDGIPTRAKVLMYTMYSKDIDEINVRLKEIDISNIQFAKSVYEGFHKTKKKTGSSLHYYCWVLAFKLKSKPLNYYKNWYLIFRHFCIRSQIDPNDLVGIEYKLLKFIAESGPDIMNKDITKQAVTRLTEFPQNYSQKWNYIKDIKEMSKDFINSRNLEEFIRK